MLNQKYKRFSKAANLRLQHDRMEVSGFGPKPAKATEKAAQEYKIELANREKRDKMVSEIQSAGKLPASAEVHIPRKRLMCIACLLMMPTSMSSVGTKFTREQAEAWIQDAKMSAKVWGGKYERYYGPDGCAYVGTVGKDIRTALSSDEFEENERAILEELKSMAYYKGVEFIPDENGIASQVKCPLVDRFIEDIDCLENIGAAEASIPDEFKKKPNWKRICLNCPFWDY